MKAFKIKLTFLLFFAIIFSAVSLQSGFLASQMKFERVRTASSEKEKFIAQKLTDYNLKTNNFKLLFIAFKNTDELEVYAKETTAKQYKKIDTYKICSKSGIAGPKRKQGDYQVPEGFYFIDRFNPASNFYLSLGINYPNLADKRKCKNTNLGGDIFIHGSCVTIGCLPMTDDKIKEIYLYAIHAKNNGQNKIPVYIFPFKMTDKNFNTFKNDDNSKKESIDFWANLKGGYELFMKNKEELNVGVKENGDYYFN